MFPVQFGESMAYQIPPDMETQVALRGIPVPSFNKAVPMGQFQQFPNSSTIKGLKNRILSPGDARDKFRQGQPKARTSRGNEAGIQVNVEMSGGKQIPAGSILQETIHRAKGYIFIFDVNRPPA
jgi:hypothetical protein